MAEDTELGSTISLGKDMKTFQPLQNKSQSHS